MIFRSEAGYHRDGDDPTAGASRRPPEGSSMEATSGTLERTHGSLTSGSGVMAAVDSILVIMQD